EACCRFAVVGDHPFGGGDSMLQKDLICLQRSLKLRLSSGIEEVRMMGTDDLVSAERQADMLGRPEIDDMVVAIQVASLWRICSNDIIGIDFRMRVSHIFEELQTIVLSFIGQFSDNPNRLRLAFAIRLQFRK